MAIDTSSISKLISDFRALSQKDSISPESLGALLQRLAELITTAAADSDFIALSKDASKYHSQIPTIVDNLKITNDYLTATMKDVSANAASIDKIKSVTDCPRIAAQVVDGKLQIVNYGYYLLKGYKPFVFRFTSKCNRANLQDYPQRKRGAKHKGWHVIGGLPNNVKFDAKGFAMFRTSPLNEWHALKDVTISHSYEAQYIVGVKGTAEGRYVPWGRKKVKLVNGQGHYLMRRFRFALGFGKDYDRNCFCLSPASLVSNLAEFSVIFDPKTDKFHFGK